MPCCSCCLLSLRRSFGSCLGHSPDNSSTPQRAAPSLQHAVALKPRRHRAKPEKGSRGTSVFPDPALIPALTPRRHCPHPSAAPSRAAPLGAAQLWPPAPLERGSLPGAAPRALPPGCIAPRPPGDPPPAGRAMKLQAVMENLQRQQRARLQQALEARQQEQQQPLRSTSPPAQPSQPPGLPPASTPARGRGQDPAPAPSEEGAEPESAHIQRAQMAALAAMRAAAAGLSHSPSPGLSDESQASEEEEEEERGEEEEEGGGYQQEMGSEEEEDL